MLGKAGTSGEVGLSDGVIGYAKTVPKDCEALERRGDTKDVIARDLSREQQEHLWRRDVRLVRGNSRNTRQLTAIEAGHHAHREPSLLSATISGFTNWLLMFGLGCAYGMIMFSDDWNKEHRALGVKMNLATAFFVGVVLAQRSGTPVAIGGPDLNPVVFVGGCIDTIAERIADDLGFNYPARRLGTCGCASPEAAEPRRLGSGFCTGSHLAQHAADCASYHEQLRATAIWSTMVSSAVLGLLFFCMGRFRPAQLGTYVPTCVTEAFLSCVGYKVFRYALKFSKLDPKQFRPAAIMGSSCTS